MERTEMTRDRQEYFKKYNANRTPEQRALYKARRSMRLANISSEKRRSKNPLIQKAYSAVKYALKTGTITCGPCVVCGKTKAEAHHDDYSKPLKVRWLCRQHHNEHHQKTLQADNN